MQLSKSWVLAGGALNQDEVFEAVRAAMVRRYYRPPVATLGAVLEAEEAIGCPLPPLLRRLFLEVANGGSGPGPVATTPPGTVRTSATLEAWTVRPWALSLGGLTEETAGRRARPQARTRARPRAQA